MFRDAVRMYPRLFPVRSTEGFAMTFEQDLCCAFSFSQHLQLWQVTYLKEKSLYKFYVQLPTKSEQKKKVEGEEGGAKKKKN